MNSFMYSVTKKVKFFENPDIVSIAVDSSGSTEGKIIADEKYAVNKILMNTNCENLVNNILSWNDECRIEILQKIEANGWTSPRTIFDKIDNNIKNLLITTDGIINGNEVNKVTEIIQNFNIRNTICILFGNNKGNFMNAYNGVSVFFPFLKQAHEKNGICYIFYYGIDKFYILDKYDTNNLNDNLGKSPVKTEQTKPEEFSACSFLDIQNIYVDKNAINGGKINDNIINIPNSTKNVNLNSLENYSKNHPEEFAQFMSEYSIDLIKGCKASDSPENFEKLRYIVGEWEKNKLSIIDNNKCQSINMFNNLIEQNQRIIKDKDKSYEQVNKSNDQISSLSKKIFTENENQIYSGIKEKREFENSINEIKRILTQEQNEIINRQINDFSIKNIISLYSVKEIQIQLVEITNNWDISGNNVICDKCIICGCKDKPMAILMNEIRDENIQLFQENISDPLYDAINLGTKNVSAILSGEFCYQCAYLLWHSGRHPITKQKIGSILILADPEKKRNIKNLSNSICCSIFGGREIKFPFLILLGIFDEIEKNEIISQSNTNFSTKVYQWVRKLVLYNTDCNLLDCYGTNKQLIKAMCDVINYKFYESKIDSCFIPMRNKTINSMSIISRCVMTEIYENNIILKEKCIIIMRRIILIIIISKITIIYRNMISGNQNYIIIYSRLLSCIFKNLISESYSRNSTIYNFEDSIFHLIFNDSNELDNLIKSKQYFELYINNKYKESEHFNLFSDKIMKIIILGIYIFINGNKNISDLYKNNEEAVKYFLDIGKSSILQERKIIELNRQIFFYGNVKEIYEISQNELLDIITYIINDLKRVITQLIERNRIIYGNEFNEYMTLIKSLEENYLSVNVCIFFAKFYGYYDKLEKYLVFNVDNLLNKEQKIIAEEVYKTILNLTQIDYCKMDLKQNLINFNFDEVEALVYKTYMEKNKY